MMRQSTIDRVLDCIADHDGITVRNMSKEIGMDIKTVRSAASFLADEGVVSVSKGLNPRNQTCKLYKVVP